LIVSGFYKDAAPTALGRRELKIPKNSRLDLRMGVFSEQLEI
jgi:hypothetical protein